VLLVIGTFVREGDDIFAVNVAASEMPPHYRRAMIHFFE
jgi:hypothetical protein